ncbi:MAG TPA: hypothetical protein VM100_01430 [Longimicrobiales bacterium]|nr:hypothetical protein [Longimicrobiales bacterium]
MSDRGVLPLPVVDALELDRAHRGALRPNEVMQDRDGRSRRLPRFFYEVDSWQTAQQVQLSDNFALWEFLTVDVREAEPLRTFPRYLPCAVTALAAHLQVFRDEVGGLVHIAANGGYRSPSHDLSRYASPHCWGTAVNIYRVGDEYLDTQEKVEKYVKIARKSLPGWWVRPYGNGDGEADDHLHIDLGYLLLVPREAPSESES